MGCSASKLEDEEAVKLCKERRNFIKQAVEHRSRFASGHIAYLQSLRQFSLALHNFVDGEEEQHSFLSDSFSTPPFTPEKKSRPEIIGIPVKSLTPTLDQSEKSTTIHVMKYLRSTGNTTVSVEEWPQAPETGTISSYYPSSDHYGGMDGFFSMEAPPVNPPFFPPPYYRPNYYPPQSPQNSHNDLFWNPFSSLDTYGYPSRMSSDDEMARLRQVREEEGIPELEEVEEEEKGEDQEDDDCDEDDDECDEVIETEAKDDSCKTGLNPTKVTVSNLEVPQTNIVSDTVHGMKGLQSHGLGSIEVPKEHEVVQVEITKNHEVVGSGGSAEKTPGFTVYMNRRFTSMAEVVKEIEDQFVRICDCGDEVSTILEASRGHHSSTSSEVAAIRLLNPVSLFHSVSSRSLSSSAFRACSESRGDVCESSSDCSEESCTFSESHQSTLDRLYLWEKKLYEEAKSGERIRVEYEKKCMQLRNLDVNGDESSSVYKIRAAARDLHTRLKVSIHSVESISRRIEALRDEELHPQLMELIHGLARMWRTMGECHRIQKRTMDEAKRLLLLNVPKRPDAPSRAKPPRCAANLESELRSWRSAFALWIAAQRSYARSLAAWAHRCTTTSDVNANADGGVIAVVDVCSRWSLFMESVSEARVVDGLDFFAAGIASAYKVGSGERGGEEDQLLMTAEKTAELVGRVLCAGMSVAAGSLADFANKSFDGYDDIIECRESKEEEEAAAARVQI